MHEAPDLQGTRSVPRTADLRNRAGNAPGEGGMGFDLLLSLSMSIERRTAFSSLLTTLAAAAFLLASAPGDSAAKDLRGRFGIGFNNNFSSLTSISVKVGMPTDRETLNIQVQGLVGFAILADEDNRFFAGGRVLLPILSEDNLNLYGAVGAGYVRFHDDLSAARVQAVLGVEFFFFGLENLGLSAEFGLNLDVAPGRLDFTTTSGTSAAVGVHYYFGAPKNARR